MYEILLFFSFVESVIGATLTSAATMCFRKPVKKRITAGLTVMFLGIISLCGVIFTRGIHAADSVAIFIILVLILAWFLICSADTFFVSVFNFLTCINIYIAISYISSMLSVHEGGVGYVTEYNIARTIIYGATIPLLFKFVRPHFRRLVDSLDKEWHAATLVPLLFLILQIVLLYYPVPYFFWERKNWNQIVIVIVYMLFLAVYYLLYIQASDIVEKYALENRNLLMVQQDKLWESELARQKAAVAMALQQLHDMHHHNAVIMKMLQTGDTDDLKTYMKSFDAALDAYNGDSFCSNPIANSIFNLYAYRASVKGINILFHVSVPENIGIDNIDLTCVLGNALENALEGCLRVKGKDEKKIIVTTKFIDNRLRVQVENTCRTDIVFDGEFPVTQKQCGGTGTKSIYYIAERYDGTAGFSVMDGKFITQIVLNARQMVSQ